MSSRLFHSGIQRALVRLSRSAQRLVTSAPPVSLTAGLALGPILVLIVVGVFLAAEALNATTSDAHPKRVALEVSSPEAMEAATPQGEWLACIEPLKSAHRAYDVPSSSCISRIFDAGYDVSPSQGVDTFCNAVVSVESNAKWMADPVAWQHWIKEQFCLHVFAANEFENIVRAEIEKLDQRLGEIDSQALIEMQFDSAYDPAALAMPPLSFDAIELAVEQEVASLVPSIESALRTQMGGFAAGFVAGNAVHDETLHALRDDEGKTSAGAHLLAIGFGALADMGTDFVAHKLSGAEDALKQHVANSADHMRGAAVHAGGSAAQLIVRHVVSLSTMHRDHLCYAVIHEIGVDQEWAVKAYNQAAEMIDQ